MSKTALLSKKTAINVKNSLKKKDLIDRKLHLQHIYGPGAYL